ncbi:MAG: MerR family transcriptional regulator [Nitrospirae bacterium]|nr:MerR family transcriptional regulator [Nitrospirota bacterium]
MTKKTYSPKEVCRLANISARQLGYWKLIGIIRPAQDLRGSRLFYRYTEHDLDLLKAVQKLTEQGYLVSRAADRIKSALAGGEEISSQSLLNLIGSQPPTRPGSLPVVPQGMDIFQKRVEEELVRSRRFKYPLSCLAIKVDVLPSDNEEIFGQVIQKVEKALVSYKRAYDMIVQAGRQEFLWLLCQTTEEVARLVAQRVPQMFPEREWFIGPLRYSIRIRIGAGTIDSSEQTGAELLARAKATLDAAVFGDKNES